MSLISYLEFKVGVFYGVCVEVIMGIENMDDVWIWFWLSFSVILVVDCIF